jgi:hypothetical protein
MEQLYKKYLELKQKEKELKKQIDEVKADIKMQLELMGTNVYDDDKVIVELKEVRRESYDSNVMKEFLNEEQLKQSLKESVFYKLDVKEKKQ